jgi:hypothetical protein
MQPTIEPWFISPVHCCASDDFTCFGVFSGLDPTRAGVFDETSFRFVSALETHIRLDAWLDCEIFGINICFMRDSGLAMYRGVRKRDELGLRRFYGPLQVLDE